MANVARPQGARPKGLPERENKYVSGGAVYPGDFVKLDSSGRVVAAAAGDALLGVANSYCSAAGQDCQVWDSPDQLFIVQSDSASVPNSQTSFGNNANIVAAAGDATYKVSRHVIDNSTISSGNPTYQLKLLDYEARPNESLDGGYLDCIVEINNHQLKGGTGTAGV